MNSSASETVRTISEQDLELIKFPSFEDDYKLLIMRQTDLDVEKLLVYLMSKQKSLIHSTGEFFTQQIVNPWETNLTDRFLENVMKIDGSNPTHICPIIIREFNEHHYHDLHFPNLSTDFNAYLNINSTRACKCVTILTFLSDYDGVAGGNIYFPKLGTRVFPEKGKSVIIFNTTREGDTIMESMFGVSVVSTGQVMFMETSIRVPI